MLILDIHRDIRLENIHIIIDALEVFGFDILLLEVFNFLGLREPDSVPSRDFSRIGYERRDAFCDRCLFTKYLLEPSCLPDLRTFVIQGKYSFGERDIENKIIVCGRYLRSEDAAKKLNPGRRIKKKNITFSCCGTCFFFRSCPFFLPYHFAQY